MCVVPSPWSPIDVISPVLRPHYTASQTATIATTTTTVAAAAAAAAAAVNDFTSRSPSFGLRPMSPAVNPNSSSSAAVPTSTSRPTRPTLARLDTSERIKAYDAVSVAAAAVKARNISQTLTLDTDCTSRQSSRTSSANPSSTSSSCNTSLTGSGGGSASINAHASGFLSAEIPKVSSPGHGGSSFSPHRRHESTVASKRRGSEPGDGDSALSALEVSVRTPLTGGSRAFSLSSGALMTAAFQASEILTNFLYLGPEITTTTEARYLRDQLGIRRILNAAWEIEDGGGKHLRLDDESKSGFERYLKLPLKDTVEATGVQRYIEEACTFLDDARLHSAPVYVHCKAGKSRSVMLVMAYLIHANRWSLQRSYAYVVERRRDVSPNIGFVAELMTFEEKRLGPSRNRFGPPSLRTNPKQDEAFEGDSKDSTVDDASAISTHLVPSAPASPTVERLPTRSTNVLDSAQAKSDLIGYRLTDEASEEEDRSASLSSTIGATYRQRRDGVNGQEEHSEPSQFAILHEYKDRDGRYRVQRPPADERLLAPVRRSTLGAVNSKNDFSRQVGEMSLDVS